MTTAKHTATKHNASKHTATKTDAARAAREKKFNAGTATLALAPAPEAAPSVADLEAAPSVADVAADGAAEAIVTGPKGGKTPAHVIARAKLLRSAGPAGAVAILVNRTTKRLMGLGVKIGDWTSTDETTNKNLAAARDHLAEAVIALTGVAQSLEVVPASYRPSGPKTAKAAPIEVAVGTIVTIREKVRAEYADCFEAMALEGKFRVAKLGTKRIGIQSENSDEIAWVPRAHLVPVKEA